jgi:deoxycytidine triphosphate deaminase
MITPVFTSAVLAHDEILKRLKSGQLFGSNSWDLNNIRAAAYDLRIADDLMIIPERGNPLGKRYGRGEKRERPVVLRPGEVAFFSTAERLCLPWDVSANIGIKFGYARRGILILTGLLVDPGFGLRRDGDSWVAKHDERLHFLAANVGPNEIVLLPGKEKIASIQFLYVSGNVLQKEVNSTEDMNREFFDPNNPAKLGLSFFEDMTELRSQFVEFRKRFEAVENGSKQIVMFGVYLLTASVLVAAFVVLLSMVSSGDLTTKLMTISTLAPKTWKGVVTLIGGGIALAMVVNSIRSLVERLATIPFRRRG